MLELILIVTCFLQIVTSCNLFFTNWKKVAAVFTNCKKGNLFYNL